MSFDGFAELPRVTLDTSVAATPSAGSTINVASNGDLQAALDAAVPGDTIVLARSATYVGNFVLKGKTGGISGGWITITVDPTGGFLAEGTRMTPTNAATYNLPKLRTAGVLPALSTEGSDTCQRYRLIGLEIDCDPSFTGSPNVQEGLVWLGDSSDAQNALTKVPQSIYLDRCYVHGHSTLDCRAGVKMNGASLAVVDSWVDQIRSTFDCQAITCSNGPGPLRIHNNHLEASTEVIAFGGAPVWIDGMNLSDVEITKNRITKPLGESGTWLTKNLIEVKWGVRVLVDSNIMDHVEAAAQFSAIVLWNAQAASPGPLFARAEDIVVRNNDLADVKWGFNLVAKYDDTIVNPMARVTIRNNATRGLNYQPDTGAGVSRWISINGMIDSLTIRHCTGFSNDSGIVWDGTVLTNHVVEDNLFGGGGPFAFQMFSPSGSGKNAVNAVFGAGSSFLGNVCADLNSLYQPITGNYFPALADVGIVGDPTQAYSKDIALSDLALASTSPYRGLATDATDPGCDMTALASATSGVDDGAGGPAPVLTSLTLSPTTETVDAGASVTVTAAALDQNSAAMTLPALTGATSNASVAVVGAITGSSVRIDGVAAGSANVTVSGGGKTSNAVAVTVNAPAPATPVLTTLTITPAILDLAVGQSGAATVTGLDQFGAAFTLPQLGASSSDGTLVAVAPPVGGALQVTALTVGVAQVTVSAGGVTSNALTVTVTAPATPTGKGHRDGPGHRDHGRRELGGRIDNAHQSPGFRDGV